MDVIASNELVHFKVAPESEAYRVCTLSELDRIPAPTRTVNPAYPAELARTSRGGHLIPWSSTSTRRAACASPR